MFRHTTGSRECPSLPAPFSMLRPCDAYIVEAMRTAEQEKEVEVELPEDCVYNDLFQL